MGAAGGSVKEFDESAEIAILYLVSRASQAIVVLSRWSKHLLGTELLYRPSSIVRARRFSKHSVESHMSTMTGHRVVTDHQNIYCCFVRYWNQLFDGAQSGGRRKFRQGKQ